MSPPPHVSPRAVVAVVAVALLACSWVVLRRLWPAQPSALGLGRALLGQLRHDARTGSYRALWLAVGAWGLLHVGLHVTWLAQGWYTRFPWLDLLSHAMGGLGVTAILRLGLRDTVPERVTGWWFVLLLFAIGAGFELYEFVFKSFWYAWPVGFYLEDTLVDLLLNATGAVIILTVGPRLPAPIRQGDPA